MRRGSYALLTVVLLTIGSSLARPEAVDAQGNDGCAFVDMRNIKPDPDLLRWPIRSDIPPPELTVGLQQITLARRCEEAGNYQLAVNFYLTGAELLQRNLPPEYTKALYDRAHALETSEGRRSNDANVPSRDACTPSGYHGIFDEGIPPRKPAAIDFVKNACDLYRQGNAAGAAKVYRQAAAQYNDAVAECTQAGPFALN
jgi:hypothetical protein